MGYVEHHLEALRAAAGAEDRGEKENMALNSRDGSDPKRPVKIKFIRNTSDGGTDYGPDYPKSVATVPFNRAQNYITSGRAVAASDDDELKEIEAAARAAGQLPDDKKSKK